MCVFFVCLLKGHRTESSLWDWDRSYRRGYILCNRCGKKIYL